MSWIRNVHTGRATDCATGEIDIGVLLTKVSQMLTILINIKVFPNTDAFDHAFPTGSTHFQQ